MYTNHLGGETSPYLLQHAHNPVEWYPWGNEALERARRERKPIHLSIGYAACHWCHVMAHESFEDEATARLLNENFVNIKVDREERPDIDRIYQIAQQMLTQRGGGWPLTMFLAHDDQRPFFGGTYFPREARHGLPGFRELLPRVVEFYRSREPEMRAQNAALVAALEDINYPPAPAGTELTDAPLKTCRAQLAQSFDRRYGGFGGAPKFPQPKALERLLRDWRASAPGEEAGLQSLYMASFTLRHMGEGGIFDQLGGGFCRYAVDERWMIPHFEKMLYDNGALLALYANPSLITADPFYGQIALATAGWALRQMQSPEGAFYSSLDADSEGHEGRFYVWDREEVRTALSAAEFAVFAPRYGLDQPPNFEGRWHLYVAATVEQIAATLQRPPAEVTALLVSSRPRLLALRAQRVSPGRDEKILTSWNALMIRGLAIAARVLRQDALADAAGRALDFLRARLWRDGRLLATCKDGRAHLNAYLDDYVYLVDAVLELQQVRFRADELEFARQLIEVVLGRFADPAAGGFFFTSDDHEQLIHRPKSFGDDATPSGNGIAALVLQRLGYLLGEPRYLAAAEGTLRAAWPALEKHPLSHATLVNALEELLQPPEIVILRGAPAAIEGWQRELAQIFAPRRLVLAIPSEASGLPPALAEKAPRGAAVAYICRGSVCSAPVESLEALIENLHPDRAALAASQSAAAGAPPR
ncbi:MAG TPA: thioredoxin domain-containing protein [Steroidobacteraceae bacterium]|nr:thioredoxin domain-containing protein [Steroidobacteraceae bacterium]